MVENINSSLFPDNITDHFEIMHFCEGPLNLPPSCTVNKHLKYFWKLKNMIDYISLQSLVMA